MKVIRRYLTWPLIGYIVLAIAIGYTIRVEAQHSTDARASLARQTRVTLIKTCERENALRKTLSDLTLNGITTIKRYVVEGTLTQAQADRAIRQSLAAAKKVAPLDCAKENPPITSE